MAEAAKGGSPRKQRRIRNYLLDRGYQLKYAGYLVAVAAVLSLFLGYLLWRTSQSLVEQRESPLARRPIDAWYRRRFGDQSPSRVQNDPPPSTVT